MFEGLKMGLRRWVVLGVAVGMAVPLAGAGAAVGAGQANPSEEGWSPPELLGATTFSRMTSVSCVNQFCVATAMYGRLYVYQQGRWSGVLDTGLRGYFESVSCGTPRFCVDVDDQGKVSLFDGEDWSVPATIDTLAETTQVSCVGRSFCAVVDQDGNVAFLHGRKWSKPEPTGVTGVGAAPALISCSAASNCMVVSNGAASQYDGDTWSDPMYADVEQPLSLSCTSASFCIAVDAEGRFVRFTGTRWTHRRKVQRRLPGLSGVSCTSKSFCMTVDGPHARQWDGHEWGDRTRIDRDGWIGKVSCSSPTLCAAVTANGDAIMYTG